MNILFTLLYLPKDIKSSGMYMDLALECVKHGQKVTVIAGTSEDTSFKDEFGMKVLRVKSMPVLYVSNMIKKASVWLRCLIISIGHTKSISKTRNMIGLSCLHLLLL